MIQMAQMLLLYFGMMENAKFSLTCFAMKRDCTLQVAKEPDHLLALTCRHGFHADQQRSDWNPEPLLSAMCYMRNKSPAIP